MGGFAPHCIPWLDRGPLTSWGIAMLEHMRGSDIEAVENRTF